jgi:hypothetical protein
MFGISIGDFSYTNRITKYGPFMHAHAQVKAALSIYSKFHDAADQYVVP